MLWRKAWLETQTRFLIGMLLIAISGCSIVYSFRATRELVPLAQTIDSRTIDSQGPLAAALRESLEMQRDLRGFVWWQWYKQNLTNLIVIFAALLGSGGLVSRGGGASLFTLSLPISRQRLIGVRAAVGLSELLALAVVPSLLLVAMAFAAGERYAVGDVIVHGVCMFAGGAVFFGVAALLSTEYADVWRPLLITCVVAMLLATCEYVLPLQPFGLFRVMNGESYFRHGGIPWIGLLTTGAIAAGLLRTAAVNLVRRDF
jgi:hypothetical protein